MNNEYLYSLNDLYTIKLFLAQWDNGQFNSDIQIISNLKNKGCECSKRLYKALQRRFEPLLGSRRPTESISHQSTFKLHIDRKYLHDELHLHFAHTPFRPLYMNILLDGNTFYTSSMRFYRLSKEDRFKCALEEIYTVATERLIIPFGYNLQDAKAIALKRLCVGLTKGYFNVYLLENYFELLYSKDEFFENKLYKLGKYA